MSDRLHLTVGGAVLLMWMVCVGRNVWTDGAYRIPTEVTSALMGIVAGLFSVPLLEWMTKRRK